MLAGMKLSTTASNPVIFGRKSPVVFHFSGNHVRPTFRRVNVSGFKEADSITNTGFRRFSSIQFNRRQNLSGELGFCGKGLRILGDNGFRVASTSSGGGSGINGGYGGSDSGGSGGSDGGGGGSGGGGGGKKWTFVSWYLSLLEAYPVWTKAVTSALLTFVGDLICQVVIDKAPSVDLKRVSLFTFLGLVLVGPTLHFWYLYLSKLVTMTGASGAFLRLIVDQFLFAPAFIGVFLSTLVTLEGRPSQVLPKLQQEWLSSIIANWQLWIPFQFLNFRFVPQQFQVLAANFIALVWNVILSYKAHKEVVAK
ncbi:protein sym-1 [Cynara cardunculus var. scolymus]|uniref:protein sym-1 n=1 Tax=Cynara cardunculus var. scolymus TaxID=59895 RepID=UPI000D6304DB|nr:protein sym-1 [Cynara cardunculus var. scolymus]